MPLIDSYDTLVLKSGQGATNGSQVFKDYSDLSHTITVVGNTQHSTAQYKFSPASIKFDGTGDSLTIPHHTGFDLGAGDFTIDWWEYVVANTTAVIAAKRVNTSSYGGFLAGYHTSGNVYFYFSTSGANWYNFLMGSVTLNTWTHFAITRTSTSTGLRVYKNGVSPSTNNGIWTMYNQASAPLTIGETGVFNGYIEELRISKGIARWNANFTPPNEAYYRSLNTTRVFYLGLADLIFKNRESQTAVADLIPKERLIYTALADQILHSILSYTSLPFQKTLEITFDAFLEYGRIIVTGTTDLLALNHTLYTDLASRGLIEKTLEITTGLSFQKSRLINIGLAIPETFSRLLETELEAYAPLTITHEISTGLGFQASRSVNIGLTDPATFSQLLNTEIEAYATIELNHQFDTGIGFESRRLTTTATVQKTAYSRLISTELAQYLTLEKEFSVATFLGFSRHFQIRAGLADQLTFSRLIEIGSDEFAQIETSQEIRTGLSVQKNRSIAVGLANPLTFSRLLTTAISEFAQIETSRIILTGLLFSTQRAVKIGVAASLEFSHILETKLESYAQITAPHEISTGLGVQKNRLISIGLTNLETYSRLVETGIQEYAPITATHATNTGLGFQAKRQVITGLVEFMTFSRHLETELLGYTPLTASHLINTALTFNKSRLTRTGLVELVTFTYQLNTRLDEYNDLATSHVIQTGLGFNRNRQVSVGIARQLVNEHLMYTTLERYTDFQTTHEVRTGLGFQAGRQLTVGLTDIIGDDFVVNTAIASLIEKSQFIETELLGYFPINHSFEINVQVGTPDIQILENELYITHNGKRVEILSCQIKTDRDSYCYSGDAEVALEVDFARLNEDDEITLTLNGITYAMIIDSLGIDRQGSSAKSGLKIELLSTTCRLDDPRSDRITKIWPAISAKAVCEEMAMQSITWDFLDWIIPDSALAVTNATRIEVIKQVIKGRAMIQTRPDGTIHVQPWYPIPPSLWGAVAPTQTLTDVTILSHSRKYSYQKRWNAVQIGDTESEGEVQCDIEEEFNDAGLGVLRLYPSPWQPMEIVHTGDNRVIVGSAKSVIETSCEQLEFKDGKASVSKPIYEMLGIEWLYANLNPIATQIDSKEITANSSVCYGYSVARVKYRYRFWEVPVTVPVPSTTQFLAI